MHPHKEIKQVLPREGAGSRRTMTGLLLVVLFMIVMAVGLFSVVQLQYSLLNGIVDETEVISCFEKSQHAEKPTRKTAFLPPKKDLARYVVESAYNQTYRVFESCPMNETFRACVQNLHENPQAMGKSFPWWFETILRDGSQRFVHAGWHNLEIINPAVKFCSIEKVACSEWKRVASDLNEGYLRKKEGPPAHAPRAVFLRDPLERFLSGFIDKCVTELRRDGERHCEPNIVFRSDLVNRSVESPDDLVKELNTDKKMFFEAYVDTMPLKWNVHFFPEGMYCDGLYRHIDNYDFIGRMGGELLLGSTSHGPKIWTCPDGCSRRKLSIGLVVLKE